MKSTRSTRPRTTRSSAAANESTRNISPNDIQTVQNLIERCLQLYMTRKDVVNTLQVQAKIEPDFTLLVWQKLEEQNPEFFKAYYTRLKVKDQMELFNTLLEYQAQLLHSDTRATNAMGAAQSQSQYPMSGGLDSTWPQRSGDAQAMHMALNTGMSGLNPSMYGGLQPQGSQMSGDFNLYGQTGMMSGAGGGGMMATASDPAGSGLLAGAGPGSSPMRGGLLSGGLGSSSMTDFSLLESKPSSDNLHERMASNSESTGATDLSGNPLEDMLLSHLPPRSISLSNLSELAVHLGGDGADPLAVFSAELDAAAQGPAREMSNASTSGAMGGLPRNFSLSDMALAFDS